MAGSSKGVKKTNAARRLDELGVAYELIGFDFDEHDLSAERAASDIGRYVVFPMTKLIFQCRI